MNIKELLKKNRLLYSFNAQIKRYTLKKDLVKLSNKYNAKAQLSGFKYDANEVVKEFKRRCQNYDPSFVPREAGELRIFWIGANQSQDESGFLQALKRISRVSVFQNIMNEYGIWNGNDGHRMAAWDEVRSANDEALLSQINRAQATDGIDVLLGQMWAHLISKEALAQVQSMGIPTINISMDDRLPIHWARKKGIRHGSVGLAPSLDMVLTTSSETCLYYGLECCPALFWPLASGPDMFKPAPDAIRDIDVLFIGNKYGIRGKIVRYLEKRGIRVNCYGAGWLNGYVNAEQNAALSKRARIILGVGTVGHCTDVYTLKLRDFDAMLTGALYITHRNPDLCMLFQEGEEIECYTTPQQAYEKIRYYLDHPEECERIGRLGQKKALLRDTWDERLGSTFRVLGLQKS